MSAKERQVTMIINGERVRMKNGDLSGPKELVDKIIKANDELRGSRVTRRTFINQPPGDLSNVYAILPLVRYIFGEENVSIDLNEPFITGTEDDPPDTIY